MKKLAKLGLVGVVLVAVVGWVLRRRIWARLLGLSPAGYDVTIHRNIRVAMRDGVTLATDYYQPQGMGPGPTVLIRTPYGRRGAIAMPTPLFAERFAERGYHVICQDTRGRFDSAGEFEPFVDEADDGATTIEWIVNQPWSDGQVGMWGASYVGYVQWAAAAHGSPHIKALVPVITQADLNLIADDGQFGLDTIARWLVVLDAMVSPTMPIWERFRHLADVTVQDNKIGAGLAHLPIAQLDQLVLGREEPFYQTWMAHDDIADPYWQAIDHRPTVGAVTAPVHLVAGWHDLFLQGQLDDYLSLERAGRAPYLTVGHWGHLHMENQLVGLQVGLDWFDVQLKGQGYKLPQKRVRLFVMGADEWRDYDVWPPAGTPTTYHLHSDKTLATTPANGQTQPSYYRYDPADPTPNVGGALMSPRAGSVDNRAVEAREDVLLFTTAPLAEATEVIGQATVTLFVRSSGAFCDFFVRLCDVYPTGESMNVCDGMVRVSPGRGQPQSDGTLKLEIELASTAYQFRPGHQIRLQIASGAHPRIARNLGTSDSVVHGTTMVAVDQTIYHDGNHLSQLILPVASG